MIGVLIDVRDRASPVVRAIGRAVDPRRLNPVVGRAVTNTYRRHLFALQNERPNKLGGTRTNYFATAARGTHFDIVADGVIVSVNQVGIRLHVLGGTVKPKTKKFLTIPARSEAHGKRAREFNDLVLVFNRAGRPVALARAAQSLIGFRRDKSSRAVTGTTRRGSSGGEIMFWLVDSVTFRPDPTIVPASLDVYAAIISSVNAHVDLAAARATNPGAN
ncbi:MAG: hypothetical protein C0518_05565 [Opitutus sp.]|nr:hypothetical protein [Opitutus sp.]